MFNRDHWLDGGISDHSLSDFARLGLIVLIEEGVDVDESIMAALSPIPDIPADSAAIQLRDSINQEFLGRPEKTNGLRLGINIHDRKKNEPLASLLVGSALKAEDYSFWVGLLNALLHPPQYLRQCRYCHRVFEPLRPQAKFCSQTCRNKASMENVS